MTPVPLYDRLPEIWRRLDTEGLLEDFLGVVDSEFVRTHGIVGALFDVHTVDRCPDMYLPLLAALVGHAWRYDHDHAWNRRRIRHAILRHSYKGTEERLDDTVLEYGVEGHSVVDMASKLLVWGAQGKWGSNDCGYVAADHFHDGAFVLDLPTEPEDPEGLREELAETWAAGEKWSFRTHVDYLLATAQSAGWFAQMGGLVSIDEDLPVDTENLNVGSYYPSIDGPLWLGFGKQVPWSDDDDPPEPIGTETDVTSPLFYLKCGVSRLAVEVEESAEDGFEMDGRFFEFIEDDEAYALGTEWLWIYAEAMINRWYDMPEGTYRQTGVFVGVQGTNGHAYPSWLLPAQVTEKGLGALVNHGPLTISGGDQRVIRIAVRVPGSGGS